MALNWTMLSPDRAPIPLPDELIIRTIETGVELTITIPNAPPTGPATSGGSGGVKKMKEPGRLFLTDQRVRPHLHLLHAQKISFSIVVISLACGSLRLFLLTATRSPGSCYLS